jgi:ssDNA-binding Zn-finger/Zn-ribbon topoisomerase 1
MLIKMEKKTKSKMGRFTAPICEQLWSQDNRKRACKKIKNTAAKRVKAFKQTRIAQSHKL